MRCTRDRGDSDCGHGVETELIDTTHIRAWVEHFDPGADAHGARARDATLALLDASDTPWARIAFNPGHLTASGLVLSADNGSVLLVYHARLRRWLQPGGHVEPSDETVVATARREVLEETGVLVEEREAPRLVSVDVHEIPAARGEPGHYHYDLMFRFVAPRRPPTGAGALRCAWVATDRLCDVGVDGVLQRAVARAGLTRSSG